MGVLGLWELLAPVGRRVSVETLAGKRLAIDASIWMVYDLVSVFDGGTPAKTAEKLLLNRLKEMRLKEQPNDLKKQRLQQSKSAGDKKRVFSVSLEEPLRDSADEDGAGGSCFQEEKMDEISSASVAEETVNDFATKGSSVTIEKIQGGIDIRLKGVFLGLSSNARYQIINILGRFNRIEMHSCGCGGV
ncbi:BnaAnng33860D [Brassica napus]|uniref:BnaAnng33860D protein n=1 Tax=Brassica napus TaxID=3708 RepID=A0A078JVL9_BRANA|nr:BnaAnng33860D [Brassica napus]